MSKKFPKTAASASPAAAPASDSRRGLFITAGALAFAAVASGAWLWSRGSGADASGQHPALASTHSPSLGQASAKVHVVEFLDPACETCAAFYPLVKQLMAEHPDRRAGPVGGPPRGAAPDGPAGGGHPGPGHGAA